MRQAGSPPVGVAGGLPIRSLQSLPTTPASSLISARRRSAYSADFEVIGDMALPDFWLDRVSFG